MSVDSYGRSTQQVNAQERQSVTVGFTLRDEEGRPVAKAALIAVTLKLYDVDTGEVINEREGEDDEDLGEDILGDDQGVTIGDDDGTYVWQLEPNDNRVVTATKTLESHVGLFVFEWDKDGAPRRHQHEVLIDVLNLGAMR